MSQPVALAAQDEIGKAVAESDDTLEEIVVFGNRPLHQLRRDFERAQEDFFAVYSSLTANDQFTIKCEYITSAGSRRRHHVCMPKFARTAQRRANEEMMTTFELMGGAQPEASMRPGGGSLGGYSFFASPANRKQMLETDAKMREDMRQQLSQSQPMQQALGELLKARDAYSSETVRRCEAQGRDCQD